MDIDDLALLLNLLRKYRHAYSVPVGVRIGAVIDEVAESIALLDESPVATE